MKNKIYNNKIYNLVLFFKIWLRQIIISKLLPMIFQIKRKYKSHNHKMSKINFKTKFKI